MVALHHCHVGLDDLDLQPVDWRTRRTIQMVALHHCHVGLDDLDLQPADWAEDGTMSLLRRLGRPRPAAGWMVDTAEGWTTSLARRLGRPRTGASCLVASEDSVITSSSSSTSFSSLFWPNTECLRAAARLVTCLTEPLPASTAAAADDNDDDGVDADALLDLPFTDVTEAENGQPTSAINSTWNKSLTFMHRVQCITRQNASHSGDEMILCYYTQAALRPLFQDNLGEPVLSQRRDLLQQPVTTGFLRAGCPSCHSTYSVKALQENAVVWPSFVLQTWYQHPMSNQQCQSTEGILCY